MSSFDIKLFSGKAANTLHVYVYLTSSRWPTSASNFRGFLIKTRFKITFNNRKL
jgi:hypothetical protein